MLKLTKRLKKMQERLFQVEYEDAGTWHFQGVNILDIPENAFMKQEAVVVRKAYAHQHICKFLPAIIKEDELIVGCPNQNSVAWGSVIPKYFDKQEQEIAERYELDECSVWGHHPPAYDKIIDMGVIGVKQEIEQAIAKQNESDAPDKMALNEYRAMLLALDGLVMFANRHADEALRLAVDCQESQRKQELMEIYKICKRIPLFPAETLQEAAQAYWFTYAIVNSGGEFIPLGRADQYLYPYYKRDMENKTIDQERAIDIIGSFLVKCNERIIINPKKAENHFSFGLFSQGVVYDEEVAESQVNGTGGYAQRALMWQEEEDIDSEANFNFGQSGNDWLMNCMVGGQHADGTDATNDISYLFVEVMHAMSLLMPTLGARIHKGTPDSFLILLARVLRHGQGEPMIYVDENIIPGFVEIGVPIEDARDYCNDGCWETLIPGKSHFSYAHVMNLRCLEWVLFQGHNLNDGLQEGIDTGDPLAFADFDAFYAAYKVQMEDRIDFQCKRRLENFGLSYMIAPDPLFSSITKDCVQKGRDISQDGARYIFHMILATGLSNAVDSLAAIKKMVYEEKKVSMSELLQALKDNWKGHERLQAMMRNAVPKFGNDNEYVDAIAVQLLKDFEERVVTWRKKQDKIMYPCGIGTFENYAVLGRDIGASADGREFGAALAPNYSPVAGTDVEGPTATFKSITKPDLRRFYAGTPLDISINANEFVDEVGVDRLKSLFTTFSDLGGQILTITASSVAELRDAQQNPENHQNLRVRMGGLSAYFIAMAPAQQENVIQRFSR
ncbi:MAG: pyruvate-formate lyase [Lachnospiraceae bacterium]|nr:pyruvate-formate lyase [Lachnospiraceae bacterium]